MGSGHKLWTLSLDNEGDIDWTLKQHPVAVLAVAIALSDEVAVAVIGSRRGTVAIEAFSLTT